MCEVVCQFVDVRTRLSIDLRGNIVLKDTIVAGENDGIDGGKYTIGGVTSLSIQLSGILVINVCCAVIECRHVSLANRKISRNLADGCRI